MNLTTVHLTFAPPQATPAATPEVGYTKANNTMSMDAATRLGAVIFSSFGELSAVCTATVIILILRQLFAWKNNYKRLIQQNQCLVLILNIFLADFILGFGAALGFYWVQTGSIDSSSGLCQAQASMLQVGETASGFFVLSLALQTMFTFLLEKPIPRLWFSLGPVAVWIFCIVLLVIGPANYGDQFFGQNHSWCFIAGKYGMQRLWFHYLWVFITEAFVVVIYLGLAIHLFRIQSKIYHLHPPRALVNRLSKTIWLLAVYPIICLALGLPLAQTRMQQLAGFEPSETRMAVTGAALASCGWINAILYSLTRRVLVTTLNTADDEYHSESGIPLTSVRHRMPTPYPSSGQESRSAGTTPTTTTQATAESSVPSSAHSQNLQIEAKREWAVFQEMKPDNEGSSSGCGLGWQRSGLNKQWFPS